MKKCWKKVAELLINLVRKMKLQKRFLLLNLFAVIFPLLFLEIATFFSVKHVFQVSNFENMQQKLYSYRELVENRLMEFSSAGNKIATSLYTIHMLQKSSDEKQLEDFVKMNEYDKLLDEWMGELADYVTAEVISTTGLIIYKPYQFVKDPPENSLLFQDIMAQDRRQVWLGARNWENTDRYSAAPAKTDLYCPLIVSTKVKGAYSSEYLGCVNLYIRQSLLASLVEEVLKSSRDADVFFADEEIFFIDGEGRIVSHRDTAKIGRKIDAGMEKILEEALPGSTEGRVTVDEDGKKKLVFSSEGRLTGMRIVALVDYEEFYQTINGIFRMMVIFSILVLAVACGISWFYFVSIKRPLVHIMGAMEQVENDDFTVTVEDTGRDELHELACQFNEMIRINGILIEQKICAEREKKDAEFRILEEQINPHFLYNTLDMINWIAYEKKEKKICHIISALSDFYRLGLNAGRHIYTIREEIRHVKAYIEIQKERYPEKTEYHFDVGDECLSCEVVKVTLQPLVENAIVHGILKKEGKGNIWIRICRKDQEIIMEVADDGAGLCTEQPETGTGSGYGLRSVDTRIRMYFGEEYGLSFSAGGAGTGAVARIRIPVVIGGRSDENFTGG